MEDAASLLSTNNAHADALRDDAITALEGVSGQENFIAVLEMLTRRSVAAQERASRERAGEGGAQRLRDQGSSEATVTSDGST